MCGVNGMRHSERLGHIVRSHLENQNGKTLCTNCQCLERDVSSAVEHFKRDHLQLQYHCTICAFISIFPSQARRHAISHVERSSYREFLYKLQHDK